MEGREQWDSRRSLERLQYGTRRWRHRQALFESVAESRSAAMSTRHEPTLLLLRQQSIVDEVRVGHHGYRRSAKKECGCGQPVVSQPRDCNVEVLHGFLSTPYLTGRHSCLGKLSNARYTAPFEPFWMAAPTPDSATAHDALCDLHRAIDVAL